MRMRGNDEQQGAVFSSINPEERIPADHPLRRIRGMMETALGQMSAHFEARYARRGRPSIPPEKLLRALWLQILYALRSEATDGADELQPAVSRVCGIESRRRGVGRDGVPQEPGAPAAGRDRATLAGSGVGAGRAPTIC